MPTATRFAWDVAELRGDVNLGPDIMADAIDDAFRLVSKHWGAL